MKRGIINFFKRDLQTAHSFLSDKLLGLRPKIKAALQEKTESIPVEVNREEVEQLLDVLPPPQTDTNHRFASLRRSLQEFLYLP